MLDDRVYVFKPAPSELKFTVNLAIDAPEDESDCREAGVHRDMLHDVKHVSVASIAVHTRKYEHY